MQHPGSNAEIARLAYAQAFRRRCHVERVESVPPPTPNPMASVAGRLAGRLVPELALAAPRGAFG